MRDNCSFLETKPGEQGLLYCTAGVNFYAVGQERELCRSCPLSDGGWTPTCEFLEVYTFLHTSKGQRQIKVRFDCWLPEGEITPSRCAACPAAGAPLPPGNGTPQVQPVQAVVRHPPGEGLLCRFPSPSRPTTRSNT